jgi:SAM-dependent methyltransferase
VTASPDRECRICGGEIAVSSYAKTRFRECRACGYAQLAEPVVNAEYWSNAEAGASHFWTDAKDAYFRAALEFLSARVAGRRLLDIGGGLGYFAEVACTSGWDAYSLDVSPRATELARRRLGDERAWQAFPRGQERTFDAATLWCVVAHTPAPESLLRLAATALRPGGVVWLTTPNFDFQRRIAPIRAALRRPIDFAGEDHVGHFTPRSLALLCGQEGFRDVERAFVGVTEVCLVFGSRNPLFIAGKRAWNRLAFAAARRKLPNLMSELQVTARRVEEARTRPGR